MGDDTKTRGSVFDMLRPRSSPGTAPASPPPAPAAPEPPVEARAEAVPVPVPAPAAPKEDYTAFHLDAPRNRATRLRVNFPGGASSLFSYAYLVEVLTTSHQYVSLIFTNCIITLQGRNLSGLLDVLQEERVLTLEWFNAERFEPPEEGAPIILGVERESPDALSGDE